jgi:hypothetical protein
MDTIFRWRRVGAILVVFAAAAFPGPRTARAGTYTMTINLLYNDVVGIRDRDAGSSQPYPFTLSGCLGTLYEDGKKVSPATDWNVVGSNKFNESISFGYGNNNKDTVSVDTIKDVKFTLSAHMSNPYVQGWYGLWSPFGNGPSSTKTYTDYDTNVHWNTDGGPDQYRTMVPQIASSELNGKALGNIDFSFPGGRTLSAAVTMTISSNQFGKYWGGFEVTTPKKKAGMDPKPGQDGTNYASADEYNELRNPVTGADYLASPLPSSYYAVPTPTAFAGGALLLAGCLGLFARRRMAV